MMRETSLDEHAASDGLEKSLAIGSISISQHRHSTHLQRDISGASNSNTRNGECSRNEMNEARAVEESQSRVVTEEEKKQDEAPIAAATRTVQTRILPPQQQQQQHTPRAPHQDYLRNVTTDGIKRAGTSWWERVVVQRSSYVIEDLVEQYTADSLFLHSDPLDVAWLDRIEVETGDVLGSGTYSNVSRVQGLELLPDFLKDHKDQNLLRRELLANSRHSDKDNTAKTENPSPSLFNTSTGYAIKHLKPELLQNSKLFEAAAADLIMEAKFLSRLSHPNILSLRGMALGGSSAFATTGLFDSYFLVVDELEETLIQRIHRWKIQGSTDQYQHNMILYKLKLAVQVASALTYLHERRLVFRDLKPHNIGLKRDGTIQLFDFGFCRELPSPSSALARGTGQPGSLPPEYTPSNTDLDDEEREQLYCMSGKGTLLYMAAEVLSSRCYNAKADVYSWSMVCYELLTLQKPFAVGSIEQHKKAVCERGQRPPLHHLRWLSPGVKELLQHAWQANVQARWHMKDIKDTLDDIIAELERTRPASFSSRSRESFGYATSSASFFCQGMEMDSIILDITNTIQTRYEYITNQIFCGGSTKDVSSAGAAKQDPTDANTVTTEPSSGGEDCKLKSDKTEMEELPVVKRPAETTGKEEQKEETFMSAASNMSTSANFWVGASPRAPAGSEHFPMTSLSMHSVRLSAARNRQVTASASSSPRHTSHSLNLGDLRSNNDGGSSRRPRRSSLSTLGQTPEDGESTETPGQGDHMQNRNHMLQTIQSEDDDMQNRNHMLQTIQSEDDGNNMDEVELEEEEEDRKPSAVTSAPGEDGSGNAGSQSIRLSNAETQYESAHEGDSGPYSEQGDSKKAPQVDEKKKAGNPQDDQSAQSTPAFVPAVASV